MMRTLLNIAEAYFTRFVTKLQSIRTVSKRVNLLNYPSGIQNQNKLTYQADYLNKKIKLYVMERIDKIQ